MSDDSDMAGESEDGFLVAEYALGLLKPDEYAALGARLRTDRALQADLRFWRGRLASLDTEFAETPAPAATWSKVERRLFPSVAKSGFWDSIALWRGLSAAAAAIAVIAIGVNIVTPRPDANAFAAQLVAALGAQGSSVQVVALYNAQSGQVRLTTVSGEKVPDKDYQLWAIEGSDAPKSLGLLKIDARNDVTLPADVLAKFGPGTTLAISLEPLGGSPNPTPSGPLVAAGKAMPI